MAAGQDDGIEEAVQADLAQVLVLLLLEPAFIFVESDLIDRIVGVGPYGPQSRTGFNILIRTCE